MRDCQPSPVSLKNFNTSGLYRIETSCLVLADLGRPRRERIGTIAFNCLGVRGWASGSDFAAAVICLSSAAVGILIVAFLDIFDIVLNLASVRSPQTDHPANRNPSVIAINEGHAIQRLFLRCQCDHP